MDSLICLRALWDRIAAGAFILGGALLVLDAGLHARDAVYVANSFSFLTSGGLGGLAALALGCTLLVSAGFHDEWRKLDRIEATLAGRVRAAAPAKTGPARWLRVEADRVTGWVLVVGSVVWLAVGARLVSGALYTPKQVAYVISGGLGAMVVLALGLAALLLADTRDEERKLALIDAALPRAVVPAPEDERPTGRRRLGVVTGTVGLVAGAALVAFGWWKAADALRVDRALDGLVVAAIGVALIAAVLTVGAVLRRRRLARQARLVLARVLPPETRAQRAAQAHPNGSSNGTLWTAAGLHHFHVAACPALAGIGPEERTPVRVDCNLEPCLLCDAGVTTDAVTTDVVTTDAVTTDAGVTADA
jgi:hypothetical protein